jgi:hypothetical protein
LGLAGGAGGIRTDRRPCSRSVRRLNTSNRLCQQDIINDSSISPGSRSPSDSSGSPSRRRPCEGAPTRITLLVLTGVSVAASAEVHVMR